MRVFDLCLSTPWAITSDALEVILAIAARDDVPLRAVEAAKGRPLDNTRAVMSRDSVAIIPIDGSIVRHGDMFSDVSGAVSVDTLAKDFTVALNDRSISAILLNVDSPGGEINGIHEFADMIHAARGQKRIVAYVSHLGCSAAYWIASACDEIVCDATASIGSIGVIAAVPNASKSRVEFVSSQSPRKRPDVSTEKGRADIQERVDALADVFVESVARNRDVPVATVLEEFGQGGIFIGKAAVAAGLVDGVGSFEATWAALVAGEPVVTAVATATDMGGPIMADKEQEYVGQRGGGFWAWIRGGDKAEFPTEAPPPVQLEARRESRPPADDPQLSELQRQLAEEKANTVAERARTAAALAGQRTIAAHGFADALVREHKILPAQADALVELHALVAAVDAEKGGLTCSDGTTTTLAALLGTVMAAAKPHGLIAETIDPDLRLRIVPAVANVDGTPVEDKALTPTKEGETIAPERQAYIMRAAGIAAKN